jgi:hypothetical protein
MSRTAVATFKKDVETRLIGGHNLRTAVATFKKDVETRLIGGHNLLFFFIELLIWRAGPIEKYSNDISTLLSFSNTGVLITDKRPDVWSRPSCIYTQIFSPKKNWFFPHKKYFPNCF